jgi:hypothetical protein
VKACRLLVALLAALLVVPAAASATPAPNAPCAAIVAPGRPIELPVQVAPGLNVRVRDPYGGVFARNRCSSPSRCATRTAPIARASPR